MKLLHYELILLSYLILQMLQYYQYTFDLYHFKFCNSTKKEEPSREGVVLPVVPFNDRKLNMEAPLSGFRTERDIPFTYSDDLVKPSESMAKEDIKVLNAMSMNRTTTSYKLNFGLAKYFQENLDMDLQKPFFSLNMYTSTSNSNEKK